MDERTRKHAHGSPERSRGPVPQHPKQQQEVHPVGRKVPVVYYLCRNRHLEHPHIIEVAISSPDGLHLRDVINQLNVLRGKGMAAMYSWSCKRSYKNGFVWQDLSDDDFILPANENEYILKGSELLDSSPSDRHYQTSSNNPKLPSSNPKQLQHLGGQLSSQSHESSPCSFNIATREVVKSQPSAPAPLIRSTLHSALPAPDTRQEDEQPPSTQEPCSSSSNASPILSKRNSSHGSDGFHSPISVECKAYPLAHAVNASTQTDERHGIGIKISEGSTKCIRDISNKNSTLSIDLDESQLNQESRLEDSEIIGDGLLLPPTTCLRKSSFSGGKTDTLESLIRAEARKMNSFRILEEEEVFIPSGPKLKATNVIMQLITCGSISVKDHRSFGLVHTYKPRFSHVNFPSPTFGGSMLAGDLDYFSEKSRLMSLRLEDKEYFSGSIIETKRLEKAQGGNEPMLKRSSSYNADRSCNSPEVKVDEEAPSHSKCLPRALKIASNKVVAKCESMRCPITEVAVNSSEGLEFASSLCSSMGSSRRLTDTSSGIGSSKRVESFKEKDVEKVIKIEERLLSGARVIIQSRAFCDD